MRERRGERGRDRGGAQGRDGAGRVWSHAGSGRCGRPTRTPKIEWVQASPHHLPPGSHGQPCRPHLPAYHMRPHGEPLCTYGVRSYLPAGAGNDVPCYRRPAPWSEAINGDLESFVFLRRPPPRGDPVGLTDLVGRVQQYRQTRGDPGVGHGQGSRPLHTEVAWLLRANQLEITPWGLARECGTRWGNRWVRCNPSGLSRARACVGGATAKRSARARARVFAVQGTKNKTVCFDHVFVTLRK